MPKLIYPLPPFTFLEATSQGWMVWWEPCERILAIDMGDGWWALQRKTPNVLGVWFYGATLKEAYENLCDAIGGES